jgi:hypothetical protein
LSCYLSLPKWKQNQAIRRNVEEVADDCETPHPFGELDHSSPARGSIVSSFDFILAVLDGIL